MSWTLRHRRCGEDEGAVLVLVLIVLMVFGLILGGLFGQGSASQNNTPVARDHAKNVAAADAGVEVGLQRLREDSQYCATRRNTPADFTRTSLANGLTVQIACSVIGSTDTTLGASGYALITTSGSAGSFTTSQGTESSKDGGRKEILGPVFMAGAPALDKPLSVHGGDVDHWCGATGGPLPQPTSNLTFDAGYGWSTCSGTVPDVLHTLPTLPCSTSSCASSPAGYTSTDGGCQVFLPGTYTSAPVLSADRINYFASGLYLFRDIGKLTIQGKTLVAGRPETPSATDADCTQTDPTQVLSPTSGNATPVSGLDGGLGISGRGATFVFSGSSQLELASAGVLKILPRVDGDGATTDFLSVVALPEDPANRGRLSSAEATINPTWSTLPSQVTTNVIIPQTGNTASQSVYGIYYTPAASVTIKATNTAVVRFLGGIVASSLELGASSSATSLQVGFERRFATRRVRITGTSKPTDGTESVTSVAVVDVSSSPGNPVTVISWRSNAPDNY